RTMRTRRSPFAPGRSGCLCGQTLSFFRSLCLGIGLLELKRSGTLRPVATAVLDELLQANLVLVDADDDTEVLPDRITLGDLIDIFLRAADERIRIFPIGQRTDHVQRFQRIRFERLATSSEAGRELAAALRRLDLAGLERIGKVEGVVHERLVR